MSHFIIPHFYENKTVIWTCDLNILNNLALHLRFQEFPLFPLPYLIIYFFITIRYNLIFYVKITRDYFIYINGEINYFRASKNWTTYRIFFTIMFVVRLLVGWILNKELKVIKAWVSSMLRGFCRAQRVYTWSSEGHHLQPSFRNSGIAELFRWNYCLRVFFYPVKMNPDSCSE